MLFDEHNFFLLKFLPNYYTFLPLLQINYLLLPLFELDVLIRYLICKGWKYSIILV